jgi:hypothetical protein
VEPVTNYHCALAVLSEGNETLLLLAVLTRHPWREGDIEQLKVAAVRFGVQVSEPISSASPS